MSNKIQVINQAFGLQAVKQFVYGSAIGSLAVANAMAPAVNFPNYGGLVGQPGTPDDPDGQSAFGSQIWGNVTISTLPYIDLLTGNSIPETSLQIDTVLMTLTQAENVVLTTIQGRVGEVIEYVGRASFRINFKGGFFSNGNARPQAEVKAFQAIINNADGIQVRSSFLGDFGVTDIVVLDKTFPQIAGGYNYQLFEFNAIQDIPVVLAQRQAQ